ncbi:flagellar hook-basal body complex protein FliE [Novosphingobium mangrovi (ex Huang et al. 2023)]|uniref:Flagellar hook-basal body complex protein FliE n=1 Tax=Novosphingobium mangrovi (ex Huang et al. 2023) TaxID=2976432 RepID=A0ABT2I034_9SPHN|nr:flagellar hook-basal body complex protein FliE [Novosphingobium mangrovi (ex Huang et al. 2023)]MCT2398168.1 flagellar hook-basal body complex protein FliE [Novosphingobium mangrovi (ex Huang et al. 2023)]
MSGVSGIGGGAGGIQQIMQMRQQIIQRNDLLKHLHSTQATDATAATGGAGAAQGPAQGFADTLKNALDGVNAVQDKAAGLTEAYQKGEVTDVAKVMLARQEAGVAFEATLQVRNKLLSAYQDIMRMGV